MFYSITYICIYIYLLILCVDALYLSNTNLFRSLDNKSWTFVNWFNWCIILQGMLASEQWKKAMIVLVILKWKWSLKLLMVIRWFWMSKLFGILSYVFTQRKVLVLKVCSVYLWKTGFSCFSLNSLGAKIFTWEYLHFKTQSCLN